MRKLLTIVALATGSLLLAGVLSVYLLVRSSVQAGKTDLQTVARMYPNFTMQQHMAILRQLQSQMHPHFKDLSAAEVVARLIARLSAGSNGLIPAANFTGNLTTVALANNHLMALAQQADCSLTLRDATYMLNFTGPVFSYALTASTPHYEQVLHSVAGLTTSSGNFPAGCGNTTSGITSRTSAFGKTSTGVRVYVTDFYDSTSGQNQIFTAVADASDNFQSFHSLGEANNAVAINVTDLNGDGNSDIVVISSAPTNTGSATVGVALGKADGTFPAPTEITLPSNAVSSAVVDDFNGDGKQDIVVSSIVYQGNGSTYQLNFLGGNGDGTFQAVKTYTVTAPSSFAANASDPYFGLISSDLRGSGHKDLITSSGILFYGNGDGTFTQSPSVAFPNELATSEYGPNVLATDVNKDGKPDLALNDGHTVQIYLGNGDGTFVAHSTYAAISNIGYLTAQDIDGDGNVDIFTGPGNNGTLAGDKFDTNLGYVLMGNGDGTFRGAPSQPFVYSGSNLYDLNGDKKVDAVGATDTSFVSYLADGKGSFSRGPSVAFSPITLSGTAYTLQLDSFAVGDLNGDGIGDLAYLGISFYGPHYAPGIFIATGKGDGSFNAPAFLPTPPFITASGDFDVNPVISAIHLADFNHDGKLDVVYTYNTSSYKTQTNYFGVAVQLGNGDGTLKNAVQLTQLTSGATAPNPGAYQIGLVQDVNKDSNPDLFLLHALSGNSTAFDVQLYLGKGDGSFGSPSPISGITPTRDNVGLFPLVLADMNNDGAPDIVALQSDTNTNLQSAIALGNGDGTFKAPNITTYNGQAFDVGLAVADFDGDGKLDISMADYIAGPQGSGICFGNGDGTLQTGGDASNGITPVQSFYVDVSGPTAALDFNGDGKPDILSGSILLLNQGVTRTAAGTTASTTALSASASSITVGGNVTFTATVTGAGNTPTGSVTFLDGATTLGTGTVNTSGIATFTTTSLTTGAHTITAQYSGDSNFAGSTSTAVTVTVQAVTASFSLSASPTSLSITPGQSGTSTLSITGSGGFAQPVTFACSGLPSEAACSFSPATVTPGASAVTTTLTLSTTAAHKASAISRSRVLAGMSLASLLLVCLPQLRRRAPWQGVLALLLACFVGAGIVSCGGGSGSGGGGGGSKTDPGTPAGTSTVTVTATGGSLSKTATLQITVP